MATQTELPFDIEMTKTKAWRDKLRQDIQEHISSLGLPGAGSEPGLSKEAIRISHLKQRKELYEHERKYLSKHWNDLPNEFANGSEVDPEKIDPELLVVDSSDFSGVLFRYASLLWSVPVSKGYGRRIRYLVRDRQNGKLMGILGLNDPVFNLSARDQWIGWNQKDRKARLVHMMDAHVVGAVPPYNYLLGGKLITSLIGSKEVSKHFEQKYADSKGIISDKRKEPKLALVTITSALGRSSMYNRLKLVNQENPNEEEILVELMKIGETKGYGHFHLSNGIFERIRQMIKAEGHRYAEGHQFGDGPNWRFRVIRVGLNELGLDKNILKHGIMREVYGMPLCKNFREFLRGEDEQPDLIRPPASEIAHHAKIRWIIPRAGRKKDYQNFSRNEIIRMINPES